MCGCVRVCTCVCAIGFCIQNSDSGGAYIFRGGDGAMCIIVQKEMSIQKNCINVF